MEKRLLHSLAFLLCALFSMAQGRFCVGMLHYEVLSETGRVVHVYDSSFPWKEAVSVDIPETVSYNGKDYTVIAIGANAFASCCSLRKIQMPESVTRIGKGAFSYCCSLQEVINLADEPQEIVHPVLGYAHIFAPETLQSARLFVKPSNLEKFKSTGGWKEFRTIVSY